MVRLWPTFISQTGRRFVVVVAPPPAPPDKPWFYFEDVSGSFCPAATSSLQLRSGVESGDSLESRAEDRRRWRGERQRNGVKAETFLGTDEGGTTRQDSPPHCSSDPWSSQTPAFLMLSSRRFEPITDLLVGWTMQKLLLLSLALTFQTGKKCICVYTHIFFSHVKERLLAFARLNATQYAIRQWLY